MLDSLMAEEKDGGMELDLEELRAQLLHILLELEETRDVSLRYQEDYLELQGESEHREPQGF